MMEILIPEPRTPRRSRTWIWAAALCAPPLIAWALIGVELTGVSRAVGDALDAVPTLVLAVIMLGSPLIAAIVAATAVVHEMRAGGTVDRRQVALAVAGLVLAALTASAAWARG